MHMMYHVNAMQLVSTGEKHVIMSYEQTSYPSNIKDLKGNPKVFLLIFYLTHQNEP